MEETNLIMEAMSKVPIVNTIATASISSIIALTIAGLTRRNKKIKNSVTKIDLDQAKKEAEDYTNKQIKIHEDKQVLEISALSEDVKETRIMVGKLLDIQLNKG